MGLGEVVVAVPGWNGLEEQGFVKAAGCLGCGQNWVAGTRSWILSCYVVAVLGLLGMTGVG